MKDPASIKQPVEIVWRAVDVLDLDPANPRISAPPSASQRDLIRHLYKHEALRELAASFARSGYFAEEPVVITAGEAPNRFRVVEGNRRVSTLKLLLDPTLRAELHVTDWPQLSEAELSRLRSIPTVAYETRDDVLPYLGFRHITGNKTWEPLAKARYIAQLVESGADIGDVSSSIGDVAGTVKRLYQAYVAYQQIGRDLGMDQDSVASSFSVLQVTLAQQPIKSFLGMTRELPTAKIEAVVPDDHLSHYREVIGWVFGDPESGQARIVSDSRLISSRLAPVVANQEALEYLRKYRDLESAYEYSGGEREYLLKQLRSAGRALRRAHGVAPLHRLDVTVQAEVEELKQLIVALEEAVAASPSQL